jgi:hypothetical protein
VLHRLDRLTLDEARTTAAQTLEVVYFLVNNLREVMNGEWILLCRLLSAEHPISQDGQASTDGIQKALGLFFRREQATSPDHILEMMQQLASDVNSSRRQFLFMLPPLTRNAESTRQVTSCDGTFEDGSHPRIHGKTTTLDVKLTIMEQPGGSSKGTLSRNGNMLVLCCGFMGNVCSSYL